MKGTLVNTATVIVGSLIGLGIGARFSEKMKTMVTSALGLTTLLIGFRMAFKSNQILLVIASLAIGGIIGELLNLEQKLENIGGVIKKRVKSQSGNFVLGFVTASLVFCVGPMTIVGSLEDRMRGDASILYAKSMLDGFASLAFAFSLGIGVLFSALIVFIYQGLLTLLGSQLAFLLTAHIINELTATGGLLIVGIGLFLLGIKKIPVGNLLPALVIVVILASIFK